LVLSGGGATGLAHIGVLKALEENNIPIDYITGTSAGALVGALYSAGYSPSEIEAYILSDDFQLMVAGKVRPNQHFLLREDDPNAELIGLSFSQDSILKKSLPTNFTSSALLDFEMMRNLGTISASYHNNFDSLFVPFRCVASDIAKKKSVIFKDGNLNAAVRASMTYPFYLRSIAIDNVLLFDGGLYNNFPADVMYESFDADYIIGSNVSYNADLPDDDDIISQLTNMLVSYSDFGLPCEEGIIIEPKPDVGTFNFANADVAIQAGYEATLLQIDSIKMQIERRVQQEDLVQRRHNFRSRFVPIMVSSITVKTDKGKLRHLARSVMKKKKPEILDEKMLSKRYFRLYAAPQIDFIYPTLALLEDSTYNLELTINKAKEFRLNVGGHFSSRPVNTGYIGLSYKTIGKVLTKTHLESYFGKFYGSGKAKFTLEVPAVYPISTSAYFVLNRWDYFRSFATFFEDVQPSFLVQNEMYSGIEMSHPLGNTLKSTFDARWYETEDAYYQSENFTNKDTTDITRVDGFSGSWAITQNSLNRRQFASSGHLFRFKARYNYGREHSLSGSTSAQPYDIWKYHSWINLSLDYQSFIVDKSFFHFGLHGQVVYNSQPLFANYTATLLSTSEFSLVPDAKTYFLPEYRSPQFVGGGINTIFTIKKKIDIRVDAYVYQPFIQITENDDGSQQFSELFKGGTYMASSSVIYHSFVGPLRVTVNYFPKQESPLAFQFSMGYVLFNDRAIR
jgi:NTE family protein